MDAASDGLIGMASQPQMSFDDLEPVSSSTTDDGEDEPTRKLDPGEEFVAEIRHIEREKGRFKNTLLHLTDVETSDPFTFWSNQTVDSALEQVDAGVGDVIGVRKSAEEQSYENDDGEEETFHPYEVAVDGGDD